MRKLIHKEPTDTSLTEKTEKRRHGSKSGSGFNTVPYIHLDKPSLDKTTTLLMFTENLHHKDSMRNN